MKRPKDASDGQKESHVLILHASTNKFSWPQHIAKISWVNVDDFEVGQKHHFFLLFLCLELTHTDTICRREFLARTPNRDFDLFYFWPNTDSQVHKYILNDFFFEVLRCLRDLQIIWCVSHENGGNFYF